MSRRIPEGELPLEVSPFGAVDLAYPQALEEARGALLRGLTVLVECDKELSGFFYASLRQRLSSFEVSCLYLDGRTAPEGGPSPVGIVGTMIQQLRDAVRGAVDQRRVVVLPHLDLLTTGTGQLTSEAREVVALLYENPEVLWLGFVDPSFELPPVMAKRFARRLSLLGVARERLSRLVTRGEARKLDPEGSLDIYKLYKYVSGINAIRLRRLLESLEGEDYPANPEPLWAQIRAATVEGPLSLPDLDLHRDIGGYDTVKARLQRDILDLVAQVDRLDDPTAIRRLEGLIPKGLVFWGPPGTGKTLFAKAMAASLGAAVQVISGPELKSRWVGESEAQLRQLFIRARHSAPSLIVFDELDSFASARGTYTGSGVEHSMVNQLLTELDGFRSNELVFVVGTTNYPEALDPALLRPGRLEFVLHIPAPDAADREAILAIYDRQLELHLSPEALAFGVRLSEYPAPGMGGPWTGDHLKGLCRALARRRLRFGQTGPSTPLDVEAAWLDNVQLPSLTPGEERVVAIHEAGHAVAAFHCAFAPAVTRLSIRGDVAGSLGAVCYAEPQRRFVVTRQQLLDTLCVLLAGREAERALLDDLSAGGAQDMAQATAIAHTMVTRYGMGEDAAWLTRGDQSPGDAPLSEVLLGRRDEAVTALLDQQRRRAQTLIHHHRAEVQALGELLVEHKTLDRQTLTQVLRHGRTDSAAPH